MAYLGKTPSQAVRSRYYYTATGGETSLSGADDNSNVLTFTDGNYVDVSLNGATLVAGSDYNTTTTNTIGGLAALTASDIVEVLVYDTFSVFGGNMAADLNFKDNVKANFGTGNDLVIYHDGSNSIINDAGTGLLKFQYGGTDGVVFDSSGNVGIGTNSPSQSLSIYANDTTDTQLIIEQDSTGDAGIQFSLTGVKNWTVGVDNSDGDKFKIENGNTIGSSNDFVINSSGSVGIGTSSPLAFANKNVELSGTGDASFNLSVGGTHTSYFYTTAAATSLGSKTNIPLVFNTNNSEAMRIDSSGNVGIGTSSPVANNASARTLQMDGAGFGVDIRLTNTATGATANNGSAVVLDSTNFYLWNYENAFTAFGTNNSERMRIDSSGNVGIGVTPEAWNSAFPSVLQIGAGMALTTSGGDNARIFGNVYYDGSYKRITSGFAHQYEQTGGTHRWYYAATGAADSTISFSEAMRIDSSGTLLVGGTSLGENGAVTMAGDGRIYAIRASDTAGFFGRTSTDGSIVNFSKDGTTVGTIGTYGGATYYTGPNSGIMFNGVHIEPTTGTGSTRADNTNSIGSSSYRFKDLYLSGGVYLGGTGSANHLDDYEEGTWTPVIDSGAFTSVTYGSQYGTYTKVGNLVTAYITLRFSGTSAGGEFRINGLPFASKFDNAAKGMFIVYSTASTYLTEGNPNMYIGSNQTFIRAYKSDGNPANANANASDDWFEGVVVYNAA